MAKGDRSASGRGAAAAGIAAAAAGSGAAAPVEAIEAWLVAYVANLLDLPESRVGTSIPFDEFGLDSIAAVAVTTELGKWLGRDVELADLDGPATIAAVARLAAGRG